VSLAIADHDSLSQGTSRLPSPRARIVSVTATRNSNDAAAGIEMPLPNTSRFELTSNLTICRILNGMWQLSGAHGYIEPKRAVEEMFTYHDAGFTTWDLADHYGPAKTSWVSYEKNSPRVGAVNAFRRFKHSRNGCRVWAR
jgi:hypothetical protein